MNTSDRALKLLGTGLTPTVVASALGVADSYISQLMADTEFAAKVVELRYASLESQSGRDAKYDELEDKLLEKLTDVIAYMVKPREILDALTKINAAKRRGQTSVDTVGTVSKIVNLTIPTIIQQNFQVSSDNQIVSVGGQELTTISPKGFQKLLTRETAKGGINENAELPIRTPVSVGS